MARNFSLSSHFVYSKVTEYTDIINHYISSDESVMSNVLITVLNRLLLKCMAIKLP